MQIYAINTMSLMCEREDLTSIEREKKTRKKKRKHTSTCVNLWPDSFNRIQGTICRPHEEA